MHAILSAEQHGKDDNPRACDALFYSSCFEGAAQSGDVRMMAEIVDAARACGCAIHPAAAHGALYRACASSAVGHSLALIDYLLATFARSRDADAPVPNLDLCLAIAVRAGHHRTISRILDFDFVESCRRDHASPAARPALDGGELFATIKWIARSHSPRAPTSGRPRRRRGDAARPQLARDELRDGIFAVDRAKKIDSALARALVRDSLGDIIAAFVSPAKRPYGAIDSRDMFRICIATIRNIGERERNDALANARAVYSLRKVDIIPGAIPIASATGGENYATRVFVVFIEAPHELTLQSLAQDTSVTRAASAERLPLVARLPIIRLPIIQPPISVAR